MTNNRIAQFLFMIIVLALAGCDTKNDFEDTFQKYFIKYYGEDGKQQGVDMIVNDDGTMLLLGTSVNDGVSRIFLVKADAEGNVLWQKKLGGVNETAVDIEATLDGDGSYVILSNVFIRTNVATSLKEYDTKLLIIDSEGKAKDSTRASAYWDDQVGFSVTPVSDKYISGGGYIIAGNRSDTKNNPIPVPGGPDLKDIIVLCYSKDLIDTLWSYSVVDQHVGAGIKVFENDTYVPLKNSDRPFYIFGYSDVLTEGEVGLEYDNNFWLSTVDENGLKNFDDYAGAQKPIQEIMSQTINDFGPGFISVGTKTNGTSSTGKSLIIARSEVVDANVGLKFTTGIIDINESNNLEAISITKSLAGGSYLILSNETSLTGTINLWLTKIDFSGTVIWSASFGSVTKNDFAGTVRELADGTIVVLGTIELESDNSKMALIKLNANGEFLN